MLFIKIHFFWSYCLLFFFGKLNPIISYSFLSTSEIRNVNYNIPFYFFRVFNILSKYMYDVYMSFLNGLRRSYFAKTIFMPKPNNINGPSKPPPPEVYDSGKHAEHGQFTLIGALVAGKIRFTSICCIISENMFWGLFFHRQRRRMAPTWRQKRPRFLYIHNK